MFRVWLAVAVAAAGIGCGAVEPRAIVIGTGATGGVYYPYGQAMAEIFNREIPAGQFSIVATGASVDNLLRMHRGELDMAITLADTLADAESGTGAFASVGKVDVKSIAILYTNYTHLMTRRDSGILRVTDLKGRTVAVGAPGSGTELVADRLMEAAGLNPRADVTRVGVGLGDALNALRDGRVDAVFLSGGVPTPAIREFANAPEANITFLPNGELLAALVAQFGPNLYRSSDIIVRSYPGVERDVAVIGVSNILVASGRLSADIVAAVTKSLYDNNETLAVAVPEARGLAWPNGPGVVPAPFHPGALAYYHQHAWR